MKAKRVRFTIRATNNLEPCIDELEVFNTAGANVALASAGTTVTSSGDTIVADRHELRYINDGHYGNSRSWMSNEKGKGWVVLEFPAGARPSTASSGAATAKASSPTGSPRLRIEVADGVRRLDTVADSDDRRKFDPRRQEARSPRSPRKGLSKDEAEAKPTALMQRRRALEARANAAATIGQKAFAGTFRTPDEIHLLNRGDPEQPKDEVVPAVLSTLGDVKLPKDTAEQERRKALADWIASPQNPLTARVMVNRIWQGHFGTGLVETPSDFGHNGTKPTHPELLDWLAQEFIRSGWSHEAHAPAHRAVGDVSADRQQSNRSSRRRSRRTPTCACSGASRRAGSKPKTIRDSMLAVSGSLNLKMTAAASICSTSAAG